MKYWIAVLMLLFVAACTQAPNDATNGSNDTADAEVREFRVTGRNFRFFMDGRESPDIVVNEGDRVRIVFESTEGFHDWVVDEFQARTEQVNPGTATTTEFVANRAGTYEYYCSVGQHRAAGMVGRLIVE